MLSLHNSAHSQRALCRKAAVLQRADSRHQHRMHHRAPAHQGPKGARQGGDGTEGWHKAAADAAVAGRQRSRRMAVAAEARRPAAHALVVAAGAHRVVVERFKERGLQSRWGGAGGFGLGGGEGHLPRQPQG